MTEAQTALSRRVVACKGWRWMPGMMRLRATPTWSRDHLKGEGRVTDGGDPWVYEDWPVIPDVTDAATVGCLLALVREAWGDPTLCVVLDTSDGRWCVERRCGDIRVFQHGTQGDTEAEALVAVLEAAP